MAKLINERVKDASRLKKEIFPSETNGRLSYYDKWNGYKIINSCRIL